MRRKKESEGASAADSSETGSPLDDELQRRLVHVEHLNAGLIHEFSNAIGIISGFAELAELDPSASDDLRQYLGQIKAAADHGSHLAKDARDALLERPVVAEKITFPVLLGDLNKQIAPTIPPGVDVIWRWDDAPATFRANKTHLRQILTNLINNSIRAVGEHGRIKVTISEVTVAAPPQGDANTALTPGPYLLLNVGDNGCGIEPEWQQKVLQPFVTSQEESGGSGLGLAITASLAMRYDGYVKLDSVVGEGTWISVYLKSR